MGAIMFGRGDGECLETWADAAPTFCWMASDIIPVQLDLRRCGWKLSACVQPGKACIGVFHAAGPDRAAWMGALAAIPREIRKHVLVTGIELPNERAALLQLGFGDAVSREAGLNELEARAARIGETAQRLPRQRQVGALKLDLLAREAFGFEKSLNLNPREFALLWRLAEGLDHMVSKQSLIQDVWRMGFVPETNSIAVHMSRLRRKLAVGGLAGMIQTVPGGYRLLAQEENHEYLAHANDCDAAPIRSNASDRPRQVEAQNG